MTPTGGGTLLEHGFRVVEPPMNASAAEYNYARFHFDLDAPGIEHWRASGPQFGEDEPDFELADLEGHLVRLSSLRGRPWC